MQNVVLVFMVFASLLCLCAVLMVMRDIIKDICANSKNKKQEVVQAPAVQQAVCVAPSVDEEAPQSVEEEQVVATQSETAEQIDSDDSISFLASDHQKTLDEKHAELSEEQKGFYEDILAYALSKEGAKDIRNNRYHEVKLGRTRLVRLLIKRDMVVCQLIMQNSNFKNYLSQNKISLKHAPIVVKVTGVGEVKLVKDSIDIIVAGIEEEKAYKKELAKQRRKANRQAGKEEK